MNFWIWVSHSAAASSASILPKKAVNSSFEGKRFFPAVIDDAVRESTLVVRQGSPLRLVPIAQLVALKLYAGGYKSKADIVELLARNPEVDLAEIRAVCDRYQLPGLDELIADASRSGM